ncbi:MAG: hypothetical protein SFU98_10910 [Leptospiraceae bacterium]|nr:hypothetical protein [Leptospiraceae bacterium]
MKKAIVNILVIVSILALWNYKTIGAKWKGNFPIIKFEINPHLIGYKSFLTENAIAFRMIEAAEEWNTKTGSRIEWQASAIQKKDEIQPFTFDVNKLIQSANEKGITPCELAKSELTKQSVPFFNQQFEDADCTSSSCAMVWSCGDQIVSANVIMNNSQFNWNDLSNDKDMIDIKTETMKNLGLLAGLTHCRAGEGEQSCSGTEPTSDSAMYRFTEPGKKQTISQDDSNGIQSIYGAYSLPFPKEGQYALNFTERAMIRDFRILESTLGYDDDLKRAEGYKFIKGLISYDERKSMKTFQEMYNDFYNKMQRQMVDADKETLLIQRDTLLIGIYQAQRAKEDLQKGIGQFEASFIDNSIQRQLELWKVTIDALGSNRN